MKNSAHVNTLGLLLFLLTLTTLTLSGCQGGQKPKASPTPAAVGTFTGQQLPDKVEKLEGTPFYSISPALSEVAKLPGACYLVIAPQDPTRALLIHEPNSKPEEVAKRESKSTEYSGRNTSVDSKALVEHVKQTYDLELNTANDGKVVILEVASAPLSGTTPADKEVKDGE